MNKFGVAIPDEDGVYHPIEEGSNLTLEQARDLAKGQSQIPGKQGTPFVVYQYVSRGDFSSQYMYLDGHSWFSGQHPAIYSLADKENDEDDFDYSDEEPDCDTGGYDDGGAEAAGQYDI